MSDTNDLHPGQRDASGDANGQPQRGFRLGFGSAIPLMIFVAMAVMFALALSSGDPSKVPSALIGKAAPDRDMPPLEGLNRDGAQVPAFRASDLANGQVTVVNFWASWCVPCRQEHPLFAQIAQQTGARIFGVNYKDPNGGGLRFLSELGNPYDRVGVDNNGRVAIDWGVYGMPETFIVDGAGKIVHKHIGPISPADLQQSIIPAIQKAQAAARAS